MIVRPFGQFFAWLWRNLAGRILIVVLLAGAVIALVVLGGRRRSASAVARHHRDGLFAEDDDPAALEREATAAAARGDHSLAVRLRFRAGLVRLHRDKAVPIRPSMTTREIARTVRLRPFDELGRTFDRVTYGDEPASPVDDDAAREGWRQVLAEVKS